MEMTDNALYLYCFARSDQLSAPPQGPGIDAKGPLALQRIGDIAAVVSEVSLADFTGPEAEERIRDLGWLAPRALRHERIIEEIAARSPVLPARLGTLFSSAERLAALVGAHHAAIRGFLDRVADHEEWAIKGHLQRAPALAARVQEALAAQAGRLSASHGVRYLQEQRARVQAEAALRRWLQETADRIWRELRSIASDAVERKVLPPEAEQPHGEMVLNWAMLVPAPRVSELRALVARLNRDLAGSGLTLQESGAWPPYSFAPSLGETEPKPQPTV
jgi:hypothetical protein